MNANSTNAADKLHWLSALLLRTRAGGLAAALSAFLLIATVISAATLIPGSPLDGLSRAHVVSANSVRLDASVYFYDGEKYSRAGRVVSTDGVRHEFQLVSDVAIRNSKQTGGLVAAITPANIGQFVKLQSPEDLHAMRADVAKAVTSIVGEVFTLLREKDYEKTTPGALHLAFLETLENPDLAGHRVALSDFLHKEISPRMSSELRALLLDRVKTALNVIVKDAFENYGTDLVRGRFDTTPIVHAVDGILADPRMLELLAEMLGILLNEPQVTEATQLFAAQYVERLFEGFSKLPGSPGKKTGPRAEMLVRQFLSLIEAQIYRNKTAHPVVVAVVANVMKPHKPRSDAILILMPAEQGNSWRIPQTVVPVQAGW